MHRGNWNILYPFLSLAKNELDDLTKVPSWIAGFTDDAIRDREDLWDILVDGNFISDLRNIFFLRQ